MRVANYPTGYESCSCRTTGKRVADIASQASVVGKTSSISLSPRSELVHSLLVGSFRGPFFAGRCTSSMFNDKAP